MDDSIIILDQDSTDSSIVSCNETLPSINDDELLLDDNDYSLEILEEDLEIVDIEVDEKFTIEVNRIEKEVEAFSPERKEVEVLFNSAEEKLRRDEEALKKYLEEIENAESEEVRPAPSLELDTSDLILNTENDSEDHCGPGGDEEVDSLQLLSKRSQEAAGLDTSVQVLDSEGEEEVEEEKGSDTPSNEDFKKPLLSKGDTVYLDYEAKWQRGFLEGGTSDGKFRIQVRKKKTEVGVVDVVVDGSSLAFSSPSAMYLLVGVKCIAQMDGEWSRGVVLEPPKMRNNYRYLVFFDQHHSRYVLHKNVRVLVGNPGFPEASRSFLERYINEYPEVPLARLSAGKSLKVEVSKKWLVAEVVEVDASLALVQYQRDSSREWIFRGSERLESIYNMIRKAGEPQRSPGSRPKRSNISNAAVTTGIEYNREEKEKRPLCRKSSKAAKRTPSVSAPAQVSVEDEKAGRIVKAEFFRVERRKFRSHECSPHCLNNSIIIALQKKNEACSPLSLPLQHGWDRQLARYSNRGLRRVFYLAPCGRRLGSLQEVLRYLKITKCQLKIEMFNFNWEVHVLDIFQAENVKISIKDFSYGEEAVPISCVNSVDEEYPGDLEYCTERLPQKFSILADAGFLVCCDCEDDCANKASCQCAQLTVESTQGQKGNKVRPSAGYVYKRLPDSVMTGIYECNSGCKCSQSCLNRVVQRPISQNLQLFKTYNRGWGLRTLNDIPAGTFICTYVGKMYEGREGNTVGKNYGDEYFADLDLIEVVEDPKRARDNESDEGLGLDTSLEENVGPDSQKITTTQPTRKSTRKSSRKKTSVKKKPVKEARVPKDFKSVRSMFGDDQDSYIMDAKQKGNIGRFLNHSCYPNVFAQNVFVDSHDLRRVSQYFDCPGSY